MAKMLGRYETPGCCSGTREGWRRVKRHGYSPDCSGAATGTRWRKRVEQRAVRQEIEREAREHR